MLGTQRYSPQDNGGAVLVPGGPADARRVSDFISGLSVRTQFLRFFASVAPPSSGLLRSLTGAGGCTDVLLATGPGGEVVGHAMAVDRITPDGALVSDIGLVVADEWQLHGVGSALLDGPPAATPPSWSWTCCPTTPGCWP
jgi:hypothetical protein